MLEELSKRGPYQRNREFIQHGTLSVYDHCVHVAMMCLQISEKLHLRVKRHELIRGALLHDFFLYDWHEPVLAHKIHGFTHPKKAMNNAVKHYRITDTEKTMIRRHMFPLTLVPPQILRHGYCASRIRSAPSRKLWKRVATVFTKGVKKVKMFLLM